MPQVWRPGRGEAGARHCPPALPPAPCCAPTEPPNWHRPLLGPVSPGLWLTGAGRPGSSPPPCSTGNASAPRPGAPAADPGLCVALTLPQTVRS